MLEPASLVVTLLQRNRKNNSFLICKNRLTVLKTGKALPMLTSRKAARRPERGCQLGWLWLWAALARGLHPQAAGGTGPGVVGALSQSEPLIQDGHLPPEGL